MAIISSLLMAWAVLPAAGCDVGPGCGLGGIIPGAGTGAAMVDALDGDIWLKKSSSISLEDVVVEAGGGFAGEGAGASRDKRSATRAAVCRVWGKGTRGGARVGEWEGGRGCVYMSGWMDGKW